MNLEQIKQRHWPEDELDTSAPSRCGRCGLVWPCEASALVEEVRRQAARIEVLEGALREIEPIVRTARGSQYPYSCERAWDICRSVLGEEHTPT